MFYYRLSYPLCNDSPSSETCLFDWGSGLPLRSIQLFACALLLRARAEQHLTGADVGLLPVGYYRNAVDENMTEPGRMVFITGQNQGRPACQTRQG